MLKELHTTNKPESATERLQKKYALWASIIHDVTVTSPPGMKLIIATRCISVAGYLGMIPLNPKWYVCLIAAATVLVAEWRLGQLASSEFRNKDSTAFRGSKEQGPAG